MNDQEMKDQYMALSNAQKQIYLARLSHYLTIHGRGFALDLSIDEQVRAFTGLNELHHQISGHIAALGIDRERYPEEVLWQILAETAGTYGLSGCLRSSIRKVSKYTNSGRTSGRN